MIKWCSLAISLTVVIKWNHLHTYCSAPNILEVNLHTYAYILKQKPNPNTLHLPYTNMQIIYRYTNFWRLDIIILSLAASTTTNIFNQQQFIFYSSIKFKHLKNSHFRKDFLHELCATVHQLQQQSIPRVSL